MRDILFRGRRIDNDEWIYGYYIHIGPVSCQRSYIIPEYASALYALEVDHSTISQYTGLTDKNGKRIFEGDVVSIEDGEFWVFSFGNCGGVQNVAHEVGYTGFHLLPLSQSAIHNRDCGQRDDPVYYINAIGLCVIGNIHDNPELLKEGADNA